MHYVRAMRPKIWPRVRFKCKVAIVPICICAVRCTNFCSGHSRLYVAAMRPYVKLQDFTLDFYFRQHWHEQLMTSHWKPTTTAINQHSASTGTTRGWTSTTPARTSLRQRRYDNYDNDDNDNDDSNDNDDNENNNDNNNDTGEDELCISNEMLDKIWWPLFWP